MLARLAKAIALTLKDQAFDMFTAVVLPNLRESLHSSVRPQGVHSPWITRNLLADKAVDGAVLAGFAPEGSAKFALPKGLPAQGKRTLAIENDPHTLDGFDGVIEEGYGKGIKSLLFKDIVIVKVKGRTFPAEAEYHVHDAERAGLHYDLCIEGLKPGTGKFEINIPRGEYKGRYAFQTTDKGIIVVPMVDRGLVHPKPDYTLKDESFLQKVAAERDDWIVEQKLDGSLGNVVINNNRAVFRSHRDTGETYYDKLPQVEFLENRSPTFLCRKFFAGPGLDRTVFKVELYHPDGAPRVAGILNALPQKARAIQSLRGPVESYAWDIIRLNGRDVSKLPYSQRRALYEQAVDRIRLFNKHWHFVARAKGDPNEFYQEITQHPLPWGEGVVIKAANAPFGEGAWFKVKQTDFHDFEIVEIQEGQGKYHGSVGRFLVRNPSNGALGEVGSLSVPDVQRDWIWQHRQELVGAVIKVRVQELTSRGAPRAGVFIAFHEGKGSTEAGLTMYAESLAGGDPVLAERTKYALKSAAGWRR
jgi:hypothetical protein